jgi:hypothetical protein
MSKSRTVLVVAPYHHHPPRPVITRQTAVEDVIAKPPTLPNVPPSHRIPSFRIERVQKEKETKNADVEERTDKCFRCSIL